jgi:hypothetical protein
MWYSYILRYHHNMKPSFFENYYKHVFVHSTAYKRRKDPNYNLKITTPQGLVLSEGNYYNLRNGQIVFLLDQTCLSPTRPFYMRERDTREMLGGILPSGKFMDFMQSQTDIISLNSCFKKI